jgi:hypothetical protein
MTPMKRLDNFSRMIIWLILGLALYLMAMLVGSDRPAVQTVFYKLGHVTILAFVGYWIARQAVGRIDQMSDPGDRLARAVVIAGVIIAGSLGL